MMDMITRDRREVHADVFRRDVQDGHDATDRRDDHADVLDMMYKMDMMQTDRREVHADVF